MANSKKTEGYTIKGYVIQLGKKDCIRVFRNGEADEPYSIQFIAKESKYWDNIHEERLNKKHLKELIDILNKIQN